MQIFCLESFQKLSGDVAMTMPSIVSILATSTLCPPAVRAWCLRVCIQLAWWRTPSRTLWWATVSCGAHSYWQPHCRRWPSLLPSWTPAKSWLSLQPQTAILLMWSTNSRTLAWTNGLRSMGLPPWVSLPTLIPCCISIEPLNEATWGGVFVWAFIFLHGGLLACMWGCNGMCLRSARKYSVHTHWWIVALRHWDIGINRR